MRHCKICNLTKDLEQFYTKPDGRRSTLCKECEKKKRLSAYYDNPQLHRDRSAKSRAKRLYNLTSQEYELARLIKECEICESNDRVAFDHCHRTKKYRGRLCFRCNTAIGFLLDNPALLMKAARYLTERGFNEIAEL